MDPKKVSDLLTAVLSLARTVDQQAARKAMLLKASTGDTFSSDRSKDQWQVPDGATSLVVAPLFDGGGNVIGLIRSARSKAHPEFSHEDLESCEQGRQDEGALSHDSRRWPGRPGEKVGVRGAVANLALARRPPGDPGKVRAPRRLRTGETKAASCLKHLFR
jgi:hypothetical protein